MISLNKIFMKRAIQIAYNGLGLISPNPMIGCVIERNGIILSEGWNYEKNMHTVITTIKKIENNNLLYDSTIYLTLEPCVFPQYSCVKKIIQKKISRVVIGSINPMNYGMGIKKLRKNGILVIENFMKKKCYSLNKRFFTFYKKKRPFIILKWNQSSDGFIDGNFYKKNEKIDQSKIIGKYSKQMIHQWRCEEDATLIEKKRRKKKLNRNFLLIKKNFFIYNQSKKIENIDFFSLERNRKIVNDLLNYLYKKKILSTIIEGERKFLEEFIKKDIWDECRIFISKIELKNGIKVPFIKKKKKKKMFFDQDNLIFLKNYS